MKSSGFPRKFTLSNWTEGPLEGLMDLSEDVEGYKQRMQTNIALASIVMIMFMALLSIVLLFEIWSVLLPLASSLVPANLSLMALRVGLIIAFLAPTFISILLMLQFLRYFGVLTKRFENVEDLFELPGNTVKLDIQQKEKQPMGRAAGFHMGLFNILRASSSFTRDIIKNMPLACRHLKHVKYMLILMPFYYVASKLVYPLIATGNFAIMPFNVFDFTIIVISIISFYAALRMIESNRFMEVLLARLCLLDRIRNSPPPKIPEAPKPAESLARYLRGIGDEYEQIKASYADEYVIKFEEGGFVVLAMQTSTVPDLDTVRRFFGEVEKLTAVIGNHLAPKGRFIILYASESGEPEDIGEDVENFILSNPIKLGRGPGGGRSETVIQIMVEDEGAYGLFPFVE